MACLGPDELRQRGPNNRADNMQVTFFEGVFFSSVHENVYISAEISLNLFFLNAQLLIKQHFGLGLNTAYKQHLWFRKWLGSEWWQAFIRSNVNTIWWCQMASLATLSWLIDFSHVSCNTFGISHILCYQIYIINIITRFSQADAMPNKLTKVHDNFYFLNEITLFLLLLSTPP